jgi:hypothetical protein
MTATTNFQCEQCDHFYDEECDLTYDKYGSKICWCCFDDLYLLCCECGEHIDPERDNHYTKIDNKETTHYCLDCGEEEGLSNDLLEECESDDE